MNGNETMEQVVDRVLALETSDDFERYVKQVFKALHDKTCVSTRRLTC